METCQRNGLPKKADSFRKNYQTPWSCWHKWVSSSSRWCLLGSLCNSALQTSLHRPRGSCHHQNHWQCEHSENNYIGIHLIISEIFLDQTGFAVSHPSHLEDKLKPGQESSLGEISPHSQWWAPLCKPLGFSPHKFSSSDAWAVAQSNFKC